MIQETINFIINNIEPINIITSTLTGIAASWIVSKYYFRYINRTKCKRTLKHIKKLYLKNPKKEAWFGHPKDLYWDLKKETAFGYYTSYHNKLENIFLIFIFMEYIDNILYLNGAEYRRNPVIIEYMRDSFDITTNCRSDFFEIYDKYGSLSKRIEYIQAGYSFSGEDVIKLREIKKESYKFIEVFLKPTKYKERFNNIKNFLKK